MRLHEVRMIELVIRISEEDYETMKHNVAIGKPMCSLSEDKMVSKVANGIPLPKGHGRLIDADKLKTHFVGTELGTDLEVYLEPEITNAPTIIKADKE